MDKKQAGEEGKEDQAGADEMLILNLVHQVALVGVKVAVEDKGGIDRRYKCLSVKNILVDFCHLAIFRKVDSGVCNVGVEVRYIQ